MKRIKAFALTDLLALISLVVMAGTGLVLFRFWPTGSGGAGKNPDYINSFIGLNHQQWVLFHDWSALVFIILMVIHLAMHCGFMKEMIGNLRK
ncbi:conserved hypothetical protein [Methanolacinia petrolearia DSM 11571]|uniref:Flavinylation-associated cytochrome domain-containing protein n=1 Tax=Methanolacinia petrolearia (strain DSM 11571 / OCM 486 / SEBR 4847) TaxID=679926 RepID=E1RE56_METP4|nr:DUF4405 domain-containing protein [Methanolacinia petrolearia]ADN36019.1 conserved hypothetical protein [Methanolacinia petrolearia DSM 11571]